MTVLVAVESPVQVVVGHFCTPPTRKVVVVRRPAASYPVLVRLGVAPTSAYAYSPEDATVSKMSA
ncbi:hypothetical protein ACFYYH_04805 [Streptomyces sp. NPDC002018]|uniref:hypothetical protein n=1 Tax=Streptomyces sp. NPDC002018 TaxID=3364629 RepID=UPI0036BCBDB5